MTENIDRRVPVIVLSGFLGSGKTTMLGELLTEGGDQRTAVIINEFGEISIDHLLVREVAETRVVLKNGCICCVIRSDLQSALRDLIDSSDAVPFDRIIIETTGLADPGPIAQTIGADPMLRRQMRLAGILSTVDAVHGASQIDDQPECLQQIAIADRLLLTKAELTESVTIAHLGKKLRKINGEAPILRKNELPGGLGNLVEEMTRQSRSVSLMACLAALPVDHAGIESVFIDTDAEIDWTAFSVWLSAFVHCHADRVLRIKGLLTIAGQNAPLALHVVRNHIHPVEHLPEWPDESRNSRIVFIVRNIDSQALKRSLLDFIGHSAAPRRQRVPPEPERSLNRVA